jgi:hypothetical protein
MTSTVITDAAGYDPAFVRSQFLTPMESAASAALDPARALFDTSPARAIAAGLASSFAGVARLFEDVVASRQSLQADTMTRPNVLRSQWTEFGGTVTDLAETLRSALVSQSASLAAALTAEALPTSGDPATVLVARQEVELALSIAGADPLQTMLEIARRGGDLAAAAASDWGRLKLRATQGGADTGFGLVASAAIESVLAGPDETRARAAAALQALTAPRPGGPQPALAAAEAFAAQVLHVTTETTRRGLVLS